LSPIDQVVTEARAPLPPEQRPVAERSDTGWAENRLAVVRRLAILIALYAVPGIVLLKPVTDNDIWWHLRTGAWVVKHGSVPPTDQFSAYGQDKPWVAYSWLFEILVYGAYEALGLTGLLLVRLGIAAVVLVAIHRFILSREPHFVRATFLTALAFFALVPLLNERPWLFTILFTVVTLGTVLRLREGTATWTVWLLPLAYILWANLHIQFIYGLAVLGLACLAPLGDALLGRAASGRDGDTFGTRPWWGLVGLSAACAVATLINPYGPRLYVVIYEYATQRVPFRVVNELMAPPFRLPFEWAFLALAGAGVYALGRRGKASLFEILLLAGTAIAAFHSRRDLWLLVVASLSVLTACPGRLAASARFALAPVRVLVVAAGLVLLLLVYAGYRGLSERALADAVARAYPVEAVKSVKAGIDEGRFPGPLFNDFDCGGYLIWALPERPVSMDGRTNLHGDARLKRHFKTIHGIDWQHDDELMVTARLVLLEKASPLADILRLEKRFHKVYEDDVAIVFVADEDEGAGASP